MSELARYVRDVPDFPSPGILFKDITPLLADARAFGFAVEEMAKPLAGAAVDCIAGIEARGFIFGPAIAQSLGVGFVPIRKPGKLPADTTSVSYTLEYGADTLEIQTDAVDSGARVGIVDDLLATGGTLAAAIDLMESLDVETVGISVLIELMALRGRDQLDGAPLHAVMQVA
ncbi:MAG: adenine phosphoribosyltransferase [Acidimicrobiales bacterium]